MGERMCEEIKKLKEGQHIWNREARGKMSRNKIREVEGSQIMHRMVSHIEILILIPRTVWNYLSVKRGETEFALRNIFPPLPFFNSVFLRIEGRVDNKFLEIQKWKNNACEHSGLKSWGVFLGSCYWKNSSLWSLWHNSPHPSTLWLLFTFSEEGLLHGLDHTSNLSIYVWWWRRAWERKNWALHLIVLLGSLEKEGLLVL